jgi:hypothetical protein
VSSKLLQLCVLGVSLSVLGCGGGSPPDEATSEEQIGQVVVDYSIAAAEGRGDAACRLRVEEKRDDVDPALVPPGMEDQLTDCASYWDWIGPRLPDAGRRVMLETQVAAVNIDGETATATATNGAVFDLRWTDGAWKLD